MTTAPDEQPPETGDAPVPDVVTGLDDVTGALRELRTWAGSPSYTRLAHAVRDARRARGVSLDLAAPGRVTVYECFRDGRRRIDVELVVDIAAALGCPRRHLPLWRHAARTAGSPGVARRTVPVVSRLPDDRPDLLGREDALQHLVDPDAPRLQWIRGLPGVGKTTLAVTAAHDLSHRGDVDQVIHVDLRGFAHDGEAADPFEVMAAVLRHHAGGTVPDHPRAQQVAYHALLAGRRTLLLLDDVPAVSPIDELLPSDASTRTIATSRWTEPLPCDADEIRVDGLTDSAAAELVGRLTGRDLSADGPAVASLCRMTGRLPLALSLVARRIADLPDWSLDDHVAAYRDRLSFLHLDDGVDGALTVMYAELPGDDRLALRRLSLHPTARFGAGAAGALTGLPGRTCTDTLARLDDAHLVRPAGDGQWQMHELVRVFGQRMAIRDERPAERDAATERLARHYIRSAADAVAALYPSAPNDWYWMDAPRAHPMPRPDAVAWLDRELTNVLATATWMIDRRQGRHAADLVAVLSTHLWETAHMPQTLALHQSARAETAADDAVGQALAERNLGMTHLRMSRYAGARDHLGRARALYREAGHTSGQMSSATNLSVVEMLTGNYEQALELSEETSRHYRETGRFDHLSSVLSNMAMMLTRLGRTGEAIARLEDVIDLARDHDLPGKERLARTNLVDLLLNSADPADLERANSVGRRAVEIATSLGDRRGTAYSRSSLATALHLAGDGAVGRAMALEVLDEAGALDAPDLAASVLNGLGEMDVRDGEHDAARHHFESALEQAEAIGEAFETDRARTGLGGLASSGPAGVS